MACQKVCEQAYGRDDA